MSTFTSLSYHVVFSTKYRKERIEDSFKDDMYSYIGGIIRGENGHLREIGGTSDHVHILAGFSPTIAVSEMVKRIKANSSKWLNEKRRPTKKFSWQAGYGAFTVSQSQIQVVRHYIETQESHQRQKTFNDMRFHTIQNMCLKLNIMVESACEIAVAHSGLAIFF